MEQTQPQIGAISLKPWFQSGNIPNCGSTAKGHKLATKGQIPTGSVSKLLQWGY